MVVFSYCWSDWLTLACDRRIDSRFLPVTCQIFPFWMCLFLRKTSWPGCVLLKYLCFRYIFRNILKVNPFVTSKVLPLSVLPLYTKRKVQATEVAEGWSASVVHWVWRWCSLLCPLDIKLECIVLSASVEHPLMLTENQTIILYVALALA